GGTMGEEGAEGALAVSLEERFGGGDDVVSVETWFLFIVGDEG
ncbi:hypothetical protein A2U01_0059700, partial [Trifolium medium]|nr:hypothetical protein [Trifolium medium]